MFTIDSNQVIRMSKGDNIEFPVFLNKGTSLKPIRYTISKNDGCELYFYIFTQNEYEKPILEKIIKSSDEGAINDDEDFVLRLTTEDTAKIAPDKYLYVIKAKLLNSQGQYETNTVTNRLPIYIIEDDYSRREWDDTKAYYVYATLSKKVEKQSYSGGTTETIDVKVNSATNKITADLASGIIDKMKAKYIGDDTLEIY